MHKNYQEEKSVDPSFQNEAKQARSLVGNLAGCVPSGRYGLPTIRERIGKTIAEFEASTGRAEAAFRAQAILDKYPEFGELLDLLGRF